MCNNGGIDPVAMGEQIAELVLPAAGAAPSVEGAAASTAVQTSNVDLTPYEGLFRNPVTGALLQVEAANGQLTLKQGDVRVLAALGEDRFQAPEGEQVRFTRTNVRATELNLSQGRFVAVQPASNDPAVLPAYVGTYYSPEHDTRITLLQRGDMLVVRQPFAVEWPLSPSFADGFTTRLRGTTTFVFERAADGEVVGVRAWANGVRGLLFSKEQP